MYSTCYNRFSLQNPVYISSYITHKNDFLSVFTECDVEISSRDVEEEGEEGDGDEDWIEPGKLNNKNRKRDKNSPRR